MSYTVRENKTFANYRAKAIVLLNSYRKYEKEYCGTLFDEVALIQKTKALEIMKSKGINLTEQDLLSEGFLELVLKQNELTELQNEAKEMFLIENDFKNAKELCSIYYTDCDFNTDMFENYSDMHSFLMETINGFFLKQRNLSSSVKSEKKPLTTE